MLIVLIILLAVFPSRSLQFVKCCPRYQHIGLSKDGNFTCTISDENDIDFDENRFMEYWDDCHNLCLDKLQTTDSNAYWMVLDCQHEINVNQSFCSLQVMYEYLSNTQLKQIKIAEGTQSTNHTKRLDLLENFPLELESCNNEFLVVNNPEISLNKFCLDLNNRSTASTTKEGVDYTPSIFNVSRQNNKLDGEKKCVSLFYSRRGTSKKIFANALIYGKLRMGTARKINGPIVLTFLSATGLLLTVLGYLILPEMKNFLGKLVTIYCFVFGLAYIIMFWGFAFDHSFLCNIRAFLLHFLMLAAFSWATLISYEIWKVLGKPCRQLHTNSIEQNWKRFLIYNLVAWSYATLWTSLTIAVWMYDFLPPPFSVIIGTYDCILIRQKVGNCSFYVFFVLPSGILVFVNAVFYILIVRYFTKVKMELNKMAENAKEECMKNCISIENNVFTFLKLGVVMGMIRVIKYLIASINYQLLFSLNWLDDVTDYTLQIQGLLTFGIFMVKRKILESLKNKIFPTH